LNPLSSLLTPARIRGEPETDLSSDNSDKQQGLSAITMLSVSAALERQLLQLQLLQQQLQQLTAQHQETLQTQAANLHTLKVNKPTATSTFSPSAVAEFQLSETPRMDTLMLLVANAVAAKTQRTGTGTTVVPLLSLLTESMLCGLLPQTVVKDLLESNRRSVSSLSRKFKNRWVRSSLKTVVSHLGDYYSDYTHPGKFFSSPTSPRPSRS
jgi:hypothetical protein